MLSFKSYIAALLCLALSLSALAACGKTRNDEDQTSTPESNVSVVGENSFYSTIDLSEYVSLCQYKDLTLDISDTDGSREDMENAVKKHIFEKSDIKKYPEPPLKYYFEQEKNFYLYLAKGDEDQYNALLVEAGVTEQDFSDIAKKYVAEDLVFYAVTEAESISLSDDEKTALFDKYVDEYVNTYGYNEKYVKKNMTDLIYDSMLYDKTIEFLIENNNFVTA